MVLVEAREFERIPCPRAGVLSAGERDPWWVLPASGACLKARWTLREAHNQWPKAFTDGFVAHLGKHVYLSAAEIPSGPASILLVPGPRYEKRGRAIVGTTIRARLLGVAQRFAQIEVNLLQPEKDSVHGDRLRIELRWTGWRRGSIAAGPYSTTDLTLIVRRSCLPGPVDLGKCATYAGIGRSGKDAIPSTRKVKGIVDFAAPPGDAPLQPFAGTLLLDVPLDGDGGGTGLLSLRVAGDELEEAWQPVPQPGR